jgi:peptidoglycan/xylan/chitin deacetylase (PgdA/CDA1 family)
VGSVVLTFDNGPTPETTGWVLDVLRDRELRAGFFVVGALLAAPTGRGLAERALAEGHWIGNHTMDHSVPLGDHPDPDYAEEQIEGTQRLLDDAGLTAEERYFRPFGRDGHIGPHLLSVRARDILLEGRYTMVLWNSVPRDWEGDAGWVDRAMVDIEAAAIRKETSVVVLHDVPDGGMDHLEAFLDRLDADGHQLTDSLPASCVPIRRGVVQSDVSGYVTP